jgi:TetR/AcrR family transcriptional repressor of nem operon
MGRAPGYDKEVLLRKLTDCFWEYGHSAPVSFLVEQAGVNAASLYAAFGSKKGMIHAAIKDYAREACAEVAELLEKNSPGREQIRYFLQTLLDTGLADPKSRGCFLVNSILEAHSDDPEIRAILNTCMDDLRAIFQKHLALAKDLRPGITAAEAALFLQVQVWGLKMMVKMGLPAESGQTIIEQTLCRLFADEPEIQEKAAPNRQNVGR